MVSRDDVRKWLEGETVGKAVEQQILRGLTEDPQIQQWERELAAEAGILDEEFELAGEELPAEDIDFLRKLRRSRLSLLEAEAGALHTLVQQDLKAASASGHIRLMTGDGEKEVGFRIDLIGKEPPTGRLTFIEPAEGIEPVSIVLADFPLFHGEQGKSVSVCKPLQHPHSASYALAAKTEPRSRRPTSRTEGDGIAIELEDRNSPSLTDVTVRVEVTEPASGRIPRVHVECAIRPGEILHRRVMDLPLPVIVGSGMYGRQSFPLPPGVDPSTAEIEVTARTFQKEDVWLLNPDEATSLLAETRIVSMPLRSLGGGSYEFALRYGDQQYAAQHEKFGWYLQFAHGQGGMKNDA